MIGIHLLARPSQTIVGSWLSGPAAASSPVASREVHPVEMRALGHSGHSGHEGTQGTGICLMCHSPSHSSLSCATASGPIGHRPTACD